MVRTLTAASLLLVAATAGCTDRAEAYCETLAENRQVLTDLADSAVEPGAENVFETSLPVFDELRDAAPDALTDEWDTFIFAWEGLAAAFEAAGVNPSEYHPEATPEISAQDQAAIEGAAEELSSPRVRDATTAIEQHALDVCDVDLTGSQLG